MNATPLILNTIDEYLGPAESRFFSRGYQRASYDVHDVIVDRAGRTVRAAADLEYPTDWSRKQADLDLRPHLSTIDALVLGVQLAELELVQTHDLSESQRRMMHLRKVTLRAGSEPQEELKNIPLSVKHLRQETVGKGSDSIVVDSHQARVGGLQVRTEIERKPGDPVQRSGTAAFDSLPLALGPEQERFYGSGFQRRRHVIHDVRADRGTWSAEAVVRFNAEPAHSMEGVDGANHPSVSLLDCFVVNLQLAQVLMYELDAIRRSESGTLWMMQTVLTREKEPVSLASTDVDLPVKTAITAKKLLPLRGGTWRTVELSGGLGGVSLRCSFAHELPGQADNSN